MNSTWQGETGIEALAFDLDGVLVDSYVIWFRVLNATLEELGRPPLTEPQFRPHWGQPMEQDIDDWFPGATPAEVEAAYARRFPEFLTEVRVLPGAVQTVESLSAAGCSKAVVTNSPRDMADALLSGAGLLECFDHVLTANDVDRSKPAPDLILAAAGALGIPTARLLVIGDSRFDALAAWAAGSPFHYFEGFEKLTPLLARGGLLEKGA